MKTAIVITVRNERRLLRQNVLYHLNCGINKIFIYLDRTTDSGADSLYDIPEVEVMNSVNQTKYAHLDYLTNFTEKANEHHTARQCLNTFDALQKCKDQKFHWLISIDADELFLPSLNQDFNWDGFFLEKKNFDLIQLKTLEVVGRRIDYDNVMAEETLFKTQKNFNSWFDRIYLKFFNPYENSYYKHSYWLGHNLGKCIINVKANIYPKNVHRYSILDNREIKVDKEGYLLHYHIYDYKDFINKYSNFSERPEVFLSGNSVDFLKLLWKNMVNDDKFDDNYLYDYYKKYLHYDEYMLNRLKQTRTFKFFKRRQPATVQVFYPRKILNPILKTV